MNKYLIVGFEGELLEFKTKKQVTRFLAKQRREDISYVYKIVGKFIPSYKTIASLRRA